MNGWSMASPLTAAVITVRRSRDITNDVKAAVKWSGGGGRDKAVGSPPIRPPCPTSPPPSTSPFSSPLPPLPRHLLLLYLRGLSFLTPLFLSPLISVERWLFGGAPLSCKLGTVEVAPETCGKGILSRTRRLTYPPSGKLWIFFFFLFSGSNMFVQLV